MTEMELIGVRVEMPTNTPIALLRERTPDARLLPIFIGGPEATAIAFALEEVSTPRPMTHDLLRNVLDELGVSLERLEITDLRDGTFFAELVLHGHDGVHRVSCRPSDGIALALRTGSEIHAAEHVLAEAGYLEEVSDDEPEEEVVEQFKEFIDSVNPEDFAS